MKLRGLSSKGQIVIPAAFFFPTLMLFVFLIFETAKLSREKIRHQFAADAAVFVEMTNYSDFLNRSAYVNGAFPMRIFFEGFHGTPMQCLGKSGCSGDKALDELLFQDGAFPRSGQSNGDPTAFQATAGGNPKWDIEFGGNRAAQMNGLASSTSSDDGGEPICKITTGSNAQQSNCITLISENTAQFWNVNWDDANQVYRLYVQIYQLLGSVESAQYQVLQRLTTGGKLHNFLQKSYWLNVGGDSAIGEASLAAQSFGQGNSDFSSVVHFHCAQYILFYGNTVTPQNLFQKTFLVASDPIPKMPDNIATNCSGIFQVVTVSPSTIDSMKMGQQGGWSAQFAWSPPSSNYFNVPLLGIARNADGTGKPIVQATAAVDGQGTTKVAASVWPDPTPKYQVRVFP